MDRPRALGLLLALLTLCITAGEWGPERPEDCRAGWRPALGLSAMPVSPRDS